MEEFLSAERSITYRIDSEKQIAYLNYSSNPAISEWKRIMNQILDDPDFHPPFGILSDRRKVPEGSPDLLESVMEHLAVCRIQGRWIGRWAVVLASESAVKQAKILHNMLHPVDVVYEVFTDFDEAERWLLSSQHA
jgi:hypothetical protein